MQSLAKRTLASIVLVSTLAFSGFPSRAEAPEPKPPTLEERLAQNRAEEKAKRAAMLGPTLYLGPIAQKYEGSGTIVYSGPLNPDKKDSAYENYALTVYHVAGDFLITDSKGKQIMVPQPGKIFDHETQLSIEDVMVDLVAYDQNAQLGMVRFITKKKCPAAKIISEKNIADLNVFREVYSVGCHDGNPPSQVKGEISSTKDTLEKKIGAGIKELPYWRYTARTVAGASGGGIYTADTYELIGLVEAIGKSPIPVYAVDKDGKPDLTKIIGYSKETKDTFNYCTPPTTIRKFLEDKGYKWILEGKTNPAVQKFKVGPTMIEEPPAPIQVGK